MGTRYRSRISARCSAPPILVTGEVTGGGFENELLVGFTRLGNLLGRLDRQAVPEMKRHRVRVGGLAGLQQGSSTSL